MSSSDFEDDPYVTTLQHDPLSIRRRARGRLLWSNASGSGELVLEKTAIAGSAPKVDLVLTDPAVSRLHAEFEPREDGIWVRDLGSKNHTYVGGMLVTGARLPDGAVVRIGATDVLVRHDEAGSEVELWPHDRFGPLVGRSVLMRELFARLARLAPTDATVLVSGETGTGKEIVAQAIHEGSPRAGKPFVVVDCAALPENLLESELFGHVKGAFTGAISSRAGALESADGGTVFLDEIGELPLALQPKLLRALESRTVRRLGESAQRKVDVRFVSATHRDLRAMVNQGAFREDLYFRLAVVPVKIPPLRARLEDVPALVEKFLPPDVTLGASLVAELQSNPWTGNVRELRNFVDRARALGTRDALASLGESRGASGRPPAGGAGATGVVDVEEAVHLGVPFKELRERSLDALERGYLEAMIRRHGRNISAIAQAAGLDRTYVHRLVRKHDL